jgi:hypothetical protein
MHRLIENYLEEALSKSGLPADHPARRHLNECGECLAEVDAMRSHSALLSELAASAEMDPRPGFYARVWERIEAQRPVSIWSLFSDSLWGRRLATAALSVAVLMGGYVVTTEREMEAPNAHVQMEEKLLPGASVLTAVSSNPDAVFMNLVSYRSR